MKTSHPTTSSLLPRNKERRPKTQYTVEQKELKPYQFNHKKGNISQGDKQAHNFFKKYKFFKKITSDRKKVNRAVLFSHRPRSNILKTQEQLMRLPSNSKNRSPQILKRSATMYVNSGS